MKTFKAKNLDVQAMSVLRRVANGAPLRRVLIDKWTGADWQRKFYLYNEPDEWGEALPSEIDADVIARLAKHGLITAPATDDATYSATERGRALLKRKGVLQPEIVQPEFFDQPEVAPWVMRKEFPTLGD